MTTLERDPQRRLALENDCGDEMEPIEPTVRLE